MSKIFFLILFSLNSVFASSLTLDQVKEQIANSNAHWTAGDTWVSKLSPQDRKHLFGVKLPEGFAEHFHSTVVNRHKTTPSSFDWRNVNGVNFVNPVLNQGSCGSCVAFSAISTFETQMNITQNTPFSPWEFSPQYLFSCGGGGCDSGWTPEGAADFLKTTGTTDDACMAYTAGPTGTDVACSNACSDASSRVEKIADYSMPTFFMADQDAVKAALQKGPLMATMVVYADFMMYQSGVYKHVTGDEEGGHEVTIVGWNDSDQAWIVKNSWGDTFGEGGYFRIAYDDESGVGSQTLAMEVPKKDGYVTLGGLRDATVLKGLTNIQMDVMPANAQNLVYTVSKNSKEVGWEKANALKSAPLDSTKYADGVYTIQANAHSTKGDLKSEPRTVYVLNGPFTGSVKITNITEGQTITGETHVEITTAASPVPFTHMTLTAVNDKTGQKMIRVMDNPTASMWILWRAQLLPNGNYTLNLEATVGNEAKVQLPPLHVKVQHS